MTDAFVIESDGKAAGIVVRERRGVRFYASSPDYAAFEGKCFASVEAVRRAMAKHQRRLAGPVKPEILHHAA